MAKEIPLANNSLLQNSGSLLKLWTLFKIVKCELAHFSMCVTEL